VFYKKELRSSFTTKLTAPYASHATISHIKEYIIVYRAFLIFSSSPTASTICMAAQVIDMMASTAVIPINQEIIAPISLHEPSLLPVILFTSGKLTPFTPAGGRGDTTFISA
jgi:hypothetical protein